MKTLANCKPSEFLVQTNKIRKSVSKWLSLTDVLNIRKRHPDIKPGISDEEMQEAIQKQAVENINSILDAVLDKYPEQTLELLALMCFIDPEDADNHPTSEYLQAFSEIIKDPAVMGFLSSLTSLDAINT